MIVCLALRGTKVAGFLEEDAYLELRSIVGTKAEPLGRLENLPTDAETRRAALAQGGVNLLICDGIPEETALQLSKDGITVVASEGGDARGVIRRVMLDFLA